MEENKDYMQLRYIDEKGNEILRFERKIPEETPFKTTILQDKSQRYYFKETKKLPKNQVFYSDIDYNVEYYTETT